MGLDDGTVPERLAEQAVYCRALGSPLYAALLEQAALASAVDHAPPVERLGELDPHLLELRDLDTGDVVAIGIVAFEERDGDMSASVFNVDVIEDVARLDTAREAD
jgi:hypothetical protein